MSSGVYMIKNVLNRKFYIGSSTNIHKRWIGHLCSLNKQRHHNIILQRQYNKYGRLAFIHGVIEYCDIKNLIDKEQEYIDKYINDPLCINLFKTAYSVSGENHPMYGKSHSEESKAKIKNARAKQVISHSAETRAKIGRPGRSFDPKNIAKMVKARNGKAWNKGIKTGIKPANTAIFPENTILDIIIRYQSGDSIESIRKLLNVSWDTVNNILTHNHIPTRNISQQKKIRDARFQKSSL